jgi:uncharacterized protein (UPF0248 family)
MVGDAQVPLLRIVSWEGRDGEMITRVFNPIQYCPLLKRRFQTSLSSLISSSRKYRISFSGLVYVIILVSFRIVTMSWFHSRENYFRFLQWSVTTTRPLSNGTIEPVEPRMVGDAQVPLLRVVPVEERDREMITRVLKSPPMILPSPCPLWYLLPANTGYHFPAWCM